MALFLDNRDLLTTALMGFTSGYVTSNTKVRFDTFGGMMTGNTVKLGISFQRGDWNWVGVYSSLIGNFAIGTLVSLWMIQKLGEKAKPWALVIFCSALIMVDGICLVVGDGNDGIYQSLTSSLAAFALGGQNLLSQKSGVVSANTTFMTGNIQKMAEAAWNQATKTGGLKPKERRAALLLVSVWTCYVIGGICGAALASKSDWSLAPAAAIYFTGMLSMQIERPKKPAGAKPVAAAKQDGGDGKGIAAGAGAVVVDVQPVSSTGGDARVGE